MGEIAYVIKIYSSMLLGLILDACNFQRTFGVSSLQEKDEVDIRKLASAIYLQVSTISQALIFVTRARSWSFVERPGLLLVGAFVIAQLVSDCQTFACLICSLLTSQINML